MATLGLSADEREAIEKFRHDVVEPSMTSLVILDFWAEWCGPCKQLTPVLEKVAADYADRGVRLVKVNVDEEKFIAAQFRIQSIPTVYALFQGQPVADLSSARTEGQLTRTLDQILSQLPIESEAQQREAEVEPLVEMGEQVLAEGDAPRAATIFRQIVEMAPDQAEATPASPALIAAARSRKRAPPRRPAREDRQGSGDRPRPLGARWRRSRPPENPRASSRGSPPIPTTSRRATSWPAR